MTGTNVLAVGVWNADAALDDLVLAPRLSLDEEFPVIDRRQLTPPRLAGVDIDGEPRVADGDGDGHAARDTGADER